jgi:S1-C subfamily serine protease
LQDCGGWVVNEWHDHAIVTPPAGLGDARALALQAVARIAEWAASEPVRSRNLLTYGVAARSGDRPSFFYAFFSTIDGNLRAYVRAGGPAYVAGLRSGDIIEKIDGLDWWRYGTYQAQQRAYDGRPHVFEIQRGGRAAEVRLSAPFTFVPEG